MQYHFSDKLYIRSQDDDKSAKEFFVIYSMEQSDHALQQAHDNLAGFQG
jgi:hypothetical protein